MKKLIYIALLFTSFSSYAQSITKEDFLNDVYTTFIDSTQKTYFLSRGAEPFMTLRDDNFKLLKRKFAGNIDSMVLERMVTKMLADTTEQRWNCPILHNAVCDFEAEFNNRNKIITYYRMSFPVFDDNYQYAIMQEMTICGPQCGNVCIFLFKKIDAHWIALTSADCEMF